MTPPTPEPSESDGQQQDASALMDSDTEAARRRRLETLRELAQGDTTSAPSVASSPQGQSISASLSLPSRMPAASRRRLWRPLMGVALVVVLIAGGAGAYILTRPHTAATRSLPAVVTITSTNCAVSVAWSLREACFCCAWIQRHKR
jgi:hypothetical protein